MRHIRVNRPRGRDNKDHQIRPYEPPPFPHLHANPFSPLLALLFWGLDLALTFSPNWQSRSWSDDPPYFTFGP